MFEFGDGKVCVMVLHATRCTKGVDAMLSKILMAEPNSARVLNIGS